MRNRTHALSLAAAFVLCAALFGGFAPQAFAQGEPAPSDPSQKIIKTRFEVLHMMYQSIQVRSLVDMRELHTFTYAPEIRNEMQSIFNAGGYRYGDKIVVWYKTRTSVALKIKGKPSKPS